MPSGYQFKTDSLHKIIKQYKHIAKTNHTGNTWT